MLSTILPQTNDRSPYRAIRTRQEYLRLLNLRRLKTHRDQTQMMCPKVVNDREGAHESR